MQALCLALAPVICPAQQAEPAAPSVTAIRAGKFIDVQTGQTLANQIILIRGAKIEAVGSNIKIPEGAAVIDLSKMTVLPGLIDCHVLETAPDQSWQRIRHVLDYSWYVPKLTYEIRATYDRPAKVSIERISGDLSVMRSSWALQSDGDYTIAHYAVVLAPGFWVPQWLVRAALKRDLPKMLRALRARAEFVQNHPG